MERNFPHQDNRDSTALFAAWSLLEQLEANNESDTPPLVELANNIVTMYDDDTITEVIAEVIGGGSLLIGRETTTLVIRDVGKVELPTNQVWDMLTAMNRPRPDAE